MTKSCLVVSDCECSDNINIRFFQNFIFIDDSDNDTESEDVYHR